MGLKLRGKHAKNDSGADAERVGVLLVNTGTPEAPTPQAVKKYLSEFLMDPRIAPMNRVVWRFILHFAILPKRSQASAEKYCAIWTDEGSPLLATHKRLAAGLSDYYRERGENVAVRFAMSYSNPTISTAVSELAAEGCTSLVVLPLYPQSAFSTTGAVSDGVARAVRKTRWKGSVTIVDNYHDDPDYVRAIAASIKHAGFNPDSDDRLMFSFHSIPLVDIEAGDTYELQAGATSLAVASELGLDRRRWTVGYQCRFDKGRAWLSPFTRTTLDSWAETGGNERVFLVCPNFAVDCLETSYDVAHEIEPGYRARKREHDGVEPAPDAFTYVPCLNKSKAHLRVLAHVLKPHVEGASHDEN